MILFRYLAKEVLVTLASLTSILLLIFMSNQFVHYLSRAANGRIPGIFIMKLMMLEMPNLMGLLLPLGLYMAFLLAYGRMYADNEMTVLQACAYGPARLLKHTLYIASFVAILVAILMVWVSPKIAIERAKLLRSTGIQTLIQTIVPGRFRALSSGNDVFYVEHMNPEHDQARHVFLARKVQKEGQAQWDIVWANKARAYTDKANGEDYVLLEEGRVYQGDPGALDYKVMEFERYRARLPHPVMAIKKDLRTAATADLLPFLNKDKKKAAELQWRIAIPLMVLSLAIVAVPLSRVQPRAGKFAKLLPAIVLFILYANFVFIGRNWIAEGKIPVWLGMWWLHALIAGFGLFLIWRSEKRCL